MEGQHVVVTRPSTMLNAPQPTNSQPATRGSDIRTASRWAPLSQQEQAITQRSTRPRGDQSSLRSVGRSAQRAVQEAVTNQNRNRGANMAFTSREVAASPGEVFAVLTTPDTYPRWLVGTETAIRSVDDTWPRPGSRFHHVVAFGPFRIADHTEVLEVDNGAMLRLSVRARPFISAVATFRSWAALVAVLSRSRRSRR